MIQRRSVSIFILHNPEPNTFLELLTGLQKRYNFIAMEQLVEALQQGNFDALPKYAAVLTLDDGHKDNYALRNTLAKLIVPATLFVCSEIIDTNRHFWSNYPLSEAEFEKLKKLSHQEMMLELQKLGFQPEKSYPDRHALSLKEILEMKSSGLVDFQSHGQFHFILTKLDHAMVQEEISNSKYTLEALLKKGIEGFAYPNGEAEEREIDLTRKAGYRYCVTNYRGQVTKRSKLHSLPRIGLSDQGGFKENIVKASGVWNFFNRVYLKLQSTA